MSALPQLPEVQGIDRKQAEKLQAHERRLDRLERRLANIKAGQIQGVHIADGAIDTDSIAAGAITADNIAAGNILAVHILADQIQANHIAAGSITTYHLQAGSITATEILAGSINADHITAGAVQAGHIAADSIQAGHIEAGAIDADHIQANSINATHIQAEQINATHIQAGSITTEHIQADSIDASRIAAGSITAAEIATDTITAGNIAAGAVTATEIAANSITGSHLSVQVTLSGMIRTGPGPGSRVEVDASGIRGYDAFNVQKFVFDTTTGGATLAGALTAQTGSAVPVTYVTSGNIVSGTIITIDPGGYLRTGPDENNAIKISSSGIVAKLGGVVKADISAATSSFTGGTFQTASPGSANRVALDGTGLKAYASDGITERVNISGGAATITAGVFRTASSPSQRMELDSTGINSYSSGTTLTYSLTPGSGLRFNSVASGYGDPQTIEWFSGGVRRGVVSAYSNRVAVESFASGAGADVDAYLNAGDGATTSRNVSVGVLSRTHPQVYFAMGNVIRYAFTKDASSTYFKMIGSGGGSAASMGLYADSTAFGMTAGDGGWTIRCANSGGPNLNFQVRINTLTKLDYLQGVGGSGYWRMGYDGSWPGSYIGDAPFVGSQGSGVAAGPNSWIELNAAQGALPGWPSNNFPTVKTGYGALYFSVNGVYSSWMGSGGNMNPQSDSRYKREIREVNTASVFERFAALPLKQYKFAHEASEPLNIDGKDDARQIKRSKSKKYADDSDYIGPMAEDFWDTFPELLPTQIESGPDTRTHLGYDERIGVLMATVQELMKRLEQADSRLAILEQ